MYLLLLYFFIIKYEENVLHRIILYIRELWSTDTPLKKIKVIDVIYEILGSQAGAVRGHRWGQWAKQRLGSS